MVFPLLLLFLSQKISLFLLSSIRETYLEIRLFVLFDSFPVVFVFYPIYFFVTYVVFLFLFSILTNVRLNAKMTLTYLITICTNVYLFLAVPLKKIWVSIYIFWRFDMVCYQKGRSQIFLVTLFVLRLFC